MPAFDPTFHLQIAVTSRPCLTPPLSPLSFLPLLPTSAASPLYPPASTRLIPPSLLPVPAYLPLSLLAACPLPPTCLLLASLSPRYIDIRGAPGGILTAAMKMVQEVLGLL